MMPEAVAQGATILVCLCDNDIFLKHDATWSKFQLKIIIIILWKFNEKGEKDKRHNERK